MPQQCQLNEIDGETHNTINYDVKPKQSAKAGKSPQENLTTESSIR